MKAILKHLFCDKWHTITNVDKLICQELVINVVQFPSLELRGPRLFQHDNALYKYTVNNARFRTTNVSCHANKVPLFIARPCVSKVIRLIQCSNLVSLYWICTKLGTRLQPQHPSIDNRNWNTDNHTGLCNTAAVSDSSVKTHPTG